MTKYKEMALGTIVGFLAGTLTAAIVHDSIDYFQEEQPKVRHKPKSHPSRPNRNKKTIGKSIRHIKTKAKKKVHNVNHKES